MLVLILSLWSSLLKFLARMREKFLQLLGKFFDWLMKRKAKNPNAGRPTLDDPSLIAQRTVINDMFSCWWGEVGWQIVTATTREELRAALEPLKDHPDKNRINRLLLASTVSADGEEKMAGMALTAV